MRITVKIGPNSLPELYAHLEALPLHTRAARVRALAHTGLLVLSGEAALAPHAGNEQSEPKSISPSPEDDQQLASKAQRLISSLDD